MISDFALGRFRKRLDALDSDPQQLYRFERIVISEPTRLPRQPTGPQLRGRTGGLGKAAVASRATVPVVKALRQDAMYRSTRWTVARVNDRFSSAPSAA